MADVTKLVKAVLNGATLQWQERDGRWLTPRDRETMLRILREDPTSTYRLAPSGGTKTCPACEGRGVDIDDETVPACPECNGTGGVAGKDGEQEPA
jgi:hypothetical protein